MPGIVKRKYCVETQDFKKEFTRPLEEISKILPLEYDSQLIIDLYKYYFPLGWDKLNKRYEYYRSKDCFLQDHGKKSRYRHQEPKSFLFNLPKFKNLLSKGVKSNHKIKYSDEKKSQAIEHLEKRKLENENANLRKIKCSHKLIQAIEPLYIDIYLLAYHKKGSTTENKIEILNELTKYKCEKSIKFLQKINDSERNNQIRRMAFLHLQKIGEFVKLRKGFKGKSKSYMTERDDFNVTPQDLMLRIESNSIQSLKKYDVFISHSYIDSELVIIIKNLLNANNINVYCDWTSDNDFLKRNLVNEYTEIVLKRRIEQSKNLVFIQTDNSLDHIGNIKSKWIEMELSYAESISKPIYCLNLGGGSPKFDNIIYDIKEQKISISPIEAKKLRT